MGYLCFLQIVCDGPNFICRVSCILQMMYHSLTCMYFVTDGVPWSDFLYILLQMVCHSLNLYIHVITDGVPYDFYYIFYRWCVIARL